METSRQLRSYLLSLSATVLVPTILLATFSGSPLGWRFPWPVFQIIFGVLFILPGLFLLVPCIRLFSTKGEGTLAPWDPPQKLVVTGPYRYTRNPMISGVFFILLGESLLLGSLALLAWAALFFAGNHAYFILSEERGLRKRFGQDYELYSRNVPRWIPRLRPWIQ